MSYLMIYVEQSTNHVENAGLIFTRDVLAKQHGDFVNQGAQLAKLQMALCRFDCGFV